MVMSSNDARLPLAVARSVAIELAGLLAPACVRIRIAGSIRREKADIGDIDLVCEPKIEREAAGLFGDQFIERDLLHDLCCRLADAGTLERRRDKNGRPTWGPNLKRAVYSGLSVDLQAVTDPTTWGAWYLIRTGPAEFNKAIVTPVWQGGKMPAGFEWHSGFQLHRYGGRVETPTEGDIFEALGYVYQEPSERGVVPFRLAPSARATIGGAG
jgi:DNA polymerase/3'-5' exonuclease PolX